MSGKTIGDLLRDSAALAPDRTAIIADDARLSYGELDGAANRLANALLSRGLGAGRTAAILSPNRAAYGIFYFGCARAGVLQAHLSTRYTAGDLVDIIGRTGVDAIFVDPGLLPLLNEARTSLPDLKTVVVFSGDLRSEIDTIDFDAFLGDAPDTPPSVEVDASAPYCITYTGGTTGVPKGVVCTQAARVMSSEMAWPIFALASEDIVFLATPLFHVAGLFSWFSTGIYGGCTFVLMDHWDGGDFLRLAEREGVTAACMVPTQINDFMSEPSLDAAKMPAFRYINYGGSPTPEALLKRVFESFPRLTMFEHYGQSEIGPACYRPPEFTLSKWNSVGRPFDELKLEIRNGDGKALSQGEVGEVTVRADYLFLEYYKDPQQTAAATTHDGWLKTGDLGYLDPEGFLFLVDRSKDLIISGGENIYPAEIENALYDHEAVAEAAVFGIPDEKWGELPAAHVVLRPGTQVSPEALIDFVATRIPRHKRPRLVEIVEMLPKTAIGKIRKNIIRARYWEGRDRAI